MTKLYEIGKEELESKIRETIRKFDIYSFHQKKKSDILSRIFIQSKSLILEYQILSCNNRSHLIIFAISPFCVLTPSYEEKWSIEFLEDLQSVLTQVIPASIAIHVGSTGY